MEAVHHAKEAKRFDGVKGAAGIYDRKALVTQKQNLVDTLCKAKYEGVLPSCPNVSYAEPHYVQWVIDEYAKYPDMHKT